MSEEDPPLKMVAPWRWHWDLIGSLALRLGAAGSGSALLLWWSPVLGIFIAAWLYEELREWCNEPLPSPTVALLPEDEEAGPGIEIHQDPSHPNRWIVTHREQPAEVEAAGPDVLPPVRDAP